MFWKRGDQLLLFSLRDCVSYELDFFLINIIFLIYLGFFIVAVEIHKSAGIEE